MALTQADFGRFFEAKKNGTYKCPFCGQERFAANLFGQASQKADPVTPVALLGVPASAPGADPPGAHHFYSFSCTNCGHTDFFHRIQVENWLATKAPNGW